MSAATVDQFPTPESLDALAKPHPYFVPVIEGLRSGAIPRPAMHDVDVLKKIRAERTAAGLADQTPSPEGVSEATQNIKMRDGHESEIRVFKPSRPVDGGSPLIVLFYGGGHVMGDNRQMTPFARAFTALYGATVINATYRLSPENPFPAGHNDAWDTFLWAGQHASELGADPAKGFVLGGVSAGGNITTVLAQNAVDQGISPAPTGLWICVPLVFDHAKQVPEKYRSFWKSREQNSEAPIINAAFIESVGKHLNADVNSPWFSPVNSKSAFKGWPRSYIEVNGLDPLRDDGIILEKLLRQNGTETKLVAWPGLPHAHFAFFPEEDFTRSAVVDTMNGMAWLLHKQVPSLDEIVKVSKPPTAG